MLLARRPAHKSVIINEWFGARNALHQINCKRIKLPAYSSDLNLIENDWKNQEYMLPYDQNEPTTKIELAAMIQSH